MSSSPEGLSLPPQPRTGVGATVLVASGVVGAALGLRYATWQWAVELAQVSAGLVHYPPDAPASALRYHFWSLLDQLIGTALRAGVSERTLSWCLSALAGMTSAQALAMLTLALTRAPLPSLLVPIVLMSVDLTAYGPGYPLMLVGLPHTYGMLGLAVAMLAVGLVGCGWWRTGAALAGLAIGVQFPIGAFVSACMVMAALSRHARIPTGTAMAFGAGLCCTAISYAVFLANRLPVPQVDSATAHVFLQAFVAAWDAHRMPIRWLSRGVVVDVAVLAATVGWLAFGTSQSLAVSSRLMLRTLASAAAISLPLAGLTHFASGSLPDAIVVAMPARLLNIGIFAAVPALASVAFVAVQRRGFSSLRRTRAAWWIAAGSIVAVPLALPVGRLGVSRPHCASSILCGPQPRRGRACS